MIVFHLRSVDSFLAWENGIRTSLRWRSVKHLFELTRSQITFQIWLKGISRIISEVKTNETIGRKSA